MRVAFTSDLHIDITDHNRKLLPYLAEEKERLSPDALVLAGDIGNTLLSWEFALQAFGRLGIMKLIVPGNHDIWVESKRALRRSQDSSWKCKVALPASAARHGFHYLPENPLQVGDLWVVGSLGWYDYSFRDERLEGFVTTREYERLGRISGTIRDMPSGFGIRILVIGASGNCDDATARSALSCLHRWSGISNGFPQRSQKS